MFADFLDQTVHPQAFEQATDLAGAFAGEVLTRALLVKPITANSPRSSILSKAASSSVRRLKPL